MSIRFSVLVPVYNVQNYLDECIQSVLSQTYPAYELILVDDGSADKSAEICDAYAEQYDCIKSYHKENGGQLHTRQYAIGKASGEYYVFLDSDDALRSNALEVLARAIEENDCDCVVFQLERVHNHKVIQQKSRPSAVCIEDKAQLYRKCLMSLEYNSMCIKAVKSTAISAETDYSAYRDVRFAEDLLQSLEVYKNSKRTLFIGDVLYNYTFNPNSVTQSQCAEKYRVDFSVRKRVMEFLKEEAVWGQSDFENYLGFCADLFCGEVIKVCSFDIGYGRKRALIRQLRETPYYKEFLEKGKYSRQYLGRKYLFYFLFQKKWDCLLIIGTTLVRKVKHAR